MLVDDLVIDPKHEKHERTKISVLQFSMPILNVLWTVFNMAKKKGTVFLERQAWLNSVYLI